MILSRKPIKFDSKAYKVMISNLMMNEAVISIDDYGYSQLKEKQKEYDSPALMSSLRNIRLLTAFPEPKDIWPYEIVLISTMKVSW